jgi:hypothetical protein
MQKNFLLPSLYFVVQSIFMNEQERAEEHLRTIRRLMERATIYRAISAPTALVGGLLSLVASGIYLALWNSNPPIVPATFPISLFVTLWLLVLIITASANTLFIVLGARKRNEPVFSASMKAALLALAPAFIMGAAITSVFARRHLEPDVDLIISIVWAGFYGIGLLATSHFAPRSLMLLGWAFFLFSILAFLFFSSATFVDLPSDREVLLSAFFMALTFGLFHLIYAACAWPRKGAAPEL